MNKSSNRKKLILIIIFLTLLSLLGGVIAAYYISNNNIEESATLIVVNPNVSIIRSGKEFLVDKKEDKLVAGDTIVTDKDGSGYIILSDNSSVTLDKDTKVTINSELNTYNSFTTKIQQLLGRTWVRVEHLGGKNAEFDLETPTTIAAVRGTQFGCSINDTSTCYAIEHNVQLTLKNMDNKSLDLPEGQLYKNTDDSNKGLESFDQFRKDNAGKWDAWYNFNVCINNYARELLTSNNSLNYLKDKLDINTCHYGNQDTSTNDASQPIQQTNPAPQPAIKPLINSISDNGNYTQGTIACNWDGANAKSYKFAIATQPYSNDNIVNWTNTTDTSKSYDLNLIYGQVYYCNLTAVNDAGESGIYSSDGIIAENSGATITSTTPSSGGFFNGVLTVNGQFTKAPISDLTLIYSIKRLKDGKYLYGLTPGGGNDWQSGYKEYDVDLTDIGNSNLYYTSGGSFKRDVGVEITLTIKNVLTNRVLDTKIIDTN